MTTMKRTLTLALVTSCLSLASSALAETPATPPPEKHEYGPKPFHYSLPFQLRPAITWNVLRSDTSYAFSQTPAGDKGTTLVTSLLFGYKVTEEIQPFVRIAYTHFAPPGLDSASAISNPLLGVTYGIKPSDDIRIAAILGITAPIGQGGGDEITSKTVAQQGGSAARMALDGALFAQNDVAIVPGVSAAWIAKGFTVQGELTFVQLMRARGDIGDKSRSILTSGLHVGYFVIPELSVGAEIRHQRFLSTPIALEKAPTDERRAELRDNTSVAFGVRGHFQLGNFWLRPGVAFAMPLDQPLAGSKTKMLQLDIPFVF
jgi:hypothetical protein